jgi:gamma-glutamylcyclotransferase (GGCT)/AIG2-like uncharacterized protein YtfP
MRRIAVPFAYLACVLGHGRRMHTNTEHLKKYQASEIQSPLKRVGVARSSQSLADTIGAPSARSAEPRKSIATLLLAQNALTAGNRHFRLRAPALSRPNFDRVRDRFSRRAPDMQMSGDPTAVFSYGTLRGDFSEDGDRWGLLRISNGTWKRGKVKGYRLYQERDNLYPFAAETGKDDDVLQGTLLQWSDLEIANAAIAHCDMIEGFDPEEPLDGLYMRNVVAVEIDGETVCTPAYIYHQPNPDEVKVASNAVKYFPDGDWLRGLRKEQDDGQIEGL